MFATSMSTQHFLLVVKAKKGLTVRQLKCYVSWVKYDVNQYGSYLLKEILSN